MRGRIIDRIFQRMHTDPDVCFITADMGISLVEKINKKFPTRFVNVGIAEQNMIGVAAGFANVGFKPFAYTISNFATHRCLEQIRNDVSLHRFPITILGTSAGYDNAPLGPTHHILDDWGAVHQVPGVDIYTPSSVDFAEGLVDRLLARGRPAYVRIPKGTPEKPAGDEHMVYVPAAISDVLLVSYGSPVQSCLEVAAGRDDVSLLAMNCLRPIDDVKLAAILARHPRVFVVEDHFPTHGLYGLFCRFVVEHGLAAKLKSIAPPEEYCLTVGTTPAFYHRKYGIDAVGIEVTIGRG